jgi:hypothetical protein
MKERLAAVIIFLCCQTLVKGFSTVHDTLIARQQVLDAVDKLPLDKLDKLYAKAEERLTASLVKSLSKFQQSEEKLLRKIQSKDSLAAIQEAKGLQQQYQQLADRVRNPEKMLTATLSGNYVPKLDSLKTLLGFRGSVLQGVDIPKLPQINELKKQLGILQVQLHNADDIKKFISQRQAAWKEQLAKLGMTKELDRLKKQAYYYQQRIREYKELLNNPDKLTEKALSLASTLPAYQDFMAQNSQLAQLFRVPGASNATANTLIPGLQTQTQVQQQMLQQLGTNTNPSQYMQQQIGQATQLLDQFKNKVNEWGGGGTELPMPEFKPNQQKTKTFWKRLEYGINIQSQRSNNFLPSTTDFGLYVGYKLNDKSIVGVGMSYKMGWGKNISNIEITHQGIGIRSFIDIKAKGSIWLTGGFEYNYQHGFRSIEELKNISAWQKSGLIGVSKKYKIGKKQGNMQLLWDFLSYSQVPTTPAIKFRLGYQL